MEISYKALFRRIIVRSKEITERLKELRYESQYISPKEFYDYMTGETPSGDTITVMDVLDNDYLMIHEIVEISELKKIGIQINKQTIMTFHPKVCETHYTATKHELHYALDKKDYGWLKLRMKHANSWLEDPNMPQHLIPRCRAIIKKLSDVLSKRR